MKKIDFISRIVIIAIAIMIGVQIASAQKPAKTPSKPATTTPTPKPTATPAKPIVKAQTDSVQMPAQTNMITGNSVGKVKLGMTVAEVRRAVERMTLSRTSDGEGVALIAVKQGGNVVMTLYAGEGNSDSKINEQARIESIEVWDKSYQTANGGHVGMLLSEVERKYGKLKEIRTIEIESRESATFTNQPEGLWFRVTGKDNKAGNYAKGESTTSHYTPGASVLSISVTGAEVATATRHRGLGESSVLGNYQRQPVENDWHNGSIVNSGGKLKWVNKAGVSWTLTPDYANSILKTENDNPYQKDGPRDFVIVDENGKVTGFKFGAELYKKID